VKSLLPIQEHFFPTIHTDFFLHSPKPEKFSGPWKEIFYIPQSQKSLLGPGMKHFTFLHAKKVWPLEGDRASLQGPDISGMGDVKGLTPVQGGLGVEF
jgi:hypothetical protein